MGIDHNRIQFHAAYGTACRVICGLSFWIDSIGHVQYHRRIAWALTHYPLFSSFCRVSGSILPDAGATAKRRSGIRESCLLPARHMEAAVVSGAADGAHGSDVALRPEAGGEQAPAGGEPAGAGPVPFRLQICRPAGQWHRPAAGPELLLLPDGRLRHRRVPWPHGAGGVSGVLRR